MDIDCQRVEWPRIPDIGVGHTTLPRHPHDAARGALVVYKYNATYATSTTHHLRRLRHLRHLRRLR
jgi:hypothetical protein